MRTKKYKQEIDWEKAEKFVREIFPKLKTDLENKLPKFSIINPLIKFNDRPPSISLYFIFNNDEKGVFLHESKELEDNLENIAEIVGLITDEHKLNVFYKGGLIKESGSYFNYSPVYTFKPNYKDFLK